MGGVECLVEGTASAKALRREFDKTKTKGQWGVFLVEVREK